MEHRDRLLAVARVPAARWPGPEAGGGPPPGMRAARPTGRRRLALQAGGGSPYRQAATRPQAGRVDGVSRSLPFSDLLALTSTNVFLAVMG
jgi:hypothetical protein